MSNEKNPTEFITIDRFTVLEKITDEFGYSGVRDKNIVNRVYDLVVENVRITK